MLDVDPANPRYKYEPKFREESKYIFDNKENTIKDSKGNTKELMAPKSLNRADRIEWLKRVNNFKVRCGYGKTSRT